jgi:serine/threonine-protein kinase
MLVGRYETLKAIASGGMATVHLGRAVGVGGFERLVAIKAMHPHIAAESEFVDMFLDEARLAARIRHPNVVATIDVQADDGLFIVMEYVDGPSLRALRKAWNKPLPPPIALRILVDALAGLHAAHELCDDQGAALKLVHRDVSPANILIGVDGVVRITDFGVARAETRLSSTRGGQLKGKIPYMPPEQLMGTPVDRRCDVYAAGVVLWEELTGRRLFRAESEGALLQKILAGPKRTPCRVNPAVPQAIDDVCMRALSKSPDDRFATAAAFADALEEAAEACGVTVASSRALARFVEESGAHDKLDARAIAALKQSPASVRDVAPPRASLTSSSGAGEHLTPPSLSGPLPSPRSGVTATEATVSARPDPRPPPTSRRGIAIGGALLALGIAAGFVLAQRGAVESDDAPAMNAPTDSHAPSHEQPSAARADDSVDDSTEHDVSADPSAMASGTASSRGPASSSGTASSSALVAKTPPLVAARPPRRPPPAKAEPAKPKPKTYDPDRL